MSVVCMGEFIVDLFAEDKAGSLAEAVRFRKFPGGAPANVAIGLHYHGVPVILVSRVGNDSMGEFLLNFLKARGMTTRGISRDNRYRTKIALVGRNAVGDRFFEFHNLKSADQNISLHDIPPDIWQDIRIFHLGGVALLGETTALTTLSLLQHLPANVTVTFDPNIRLDLVKDSHRVRMRLHKVLEYVDVLKCSEVDWKLLFTEPERTAFLTNSDKITIISRGSASTIIHLRGRRFEIPVQAVTAVDTTGAGDAFMAALLARMHHWLADHSLNQAEMNQWEEWIRWANSWGARCVQFQGALGCYE